MTVFAHSQTTNKLVNEAANDSARVSGQDRKIPPLSEPIRLQDLEDAARSQAWKKIKRMLYTYLYISMSPVDSMQRFT